VPAKTPLESKYRVNEATGCWEWVAAKSRSGYGYLGRKRAHRAVYSLYRGSIPDGLVLDHLCRNTCCVNPDHLEPVTTAENTRRGLSAKLKEADCRPIREAFAAGETGTAIAKLYGVSPSLIGLITTGKVWRGTDSDNLTGLADTSRYGSGRRVLSDSDIDSIIRRHEAGESQAGLGRCFGVSNQHISRIVNGQRRNKRCAQ
jgi:hypothetical protein